MRLLQDEGLLSEERSELLLSWRHTGFSVHNRVRVEPEDQPVVDKILRHLKRRAENGRQRGPPGRSEFAAVS